MIARALLWLRSLLFRGRLEREMQAEMAEHMARATERLMARGLSPDAAQHAARREFGNATFLQEEGRIARGTSGVDTLVGDLRFAIRHFARNPLSTLTMVTVLAIGIAINVVLYTMVHSFTERPPSGVDASADVVRIRGSQVGTGSRTERPFTRNEVQGYAGLGAQFAEVAAWTSQPVTAAAPGIDEFTVTATFVTDDYFSVLGTRSLLGRMLVAGDAAPVAVLSHGAWTRSFGADPRIVGRIITLGDVPFTIVGVARPRFRGAAWEARDEMQVWVPLDSRRRVLSVEKDDAPVFLAIGKLQAGVSRQAATAAAVVVAARATSERATNTIDAADSLARDPSVDVVPLLADNLEPEFEATVRNVRLACSILGLLTLLVTCANVGSLQTGLALSRRREIAIRMSLGARRARLVRQLVTESLLVSVVAGVGAVGVTLFLMRTALGVVGTFSFDIVYDASAVAFTFAVALAAGVLFGLSPALHATRVAIGGALKDSSGAVAGGRTRLQRSLVVTQIALTQPLAVGVVLLVFTGIHEYRQNPPNPYGSRIVQLRLSSGSARATADSTAQPAAVQRDRQETERLVAAFRELPGVTSATFVPSRTVINFEGFRLPDARGIGSENAFYILGRAASPEYLEMTGTPVILGRDLEAADTTRFNSAAIPVVIGDDMARDLWGDANPIGRRVERAVGEAAMTLEVVGVYKEDVPARGHARNPYSVIVPDDPRLVVPAPSRLIMIRSSSSAESLIPVVRGIARAQAPDAAIMELRTLAALQDEERHTLWGGIALFSSAGLVVLLLCALGLYAVIAFAVGQRTSEIAVRMAIGARTRQIVRQFAFDGLRLTAIGVGVGLPLSILGMHQLMSVGPETPDVSEWTVMLIVGIGVLLVAAVASWIPASRAADVDPAVILRRD